MYLLIFIVFFITCIHLLTIIQPLLFHILFPVLLALLQVPYPGHLPLRGLLQLAHHAASRDLYPGVRNKCII
jgi:hypothetical protein